MTKSKMIEIIKNNESVAYEALVKNENEFGKYDNLTTHARRSWATLYQLLIDLEIENLDA